MIFLTFERILFMAPGLIELYKFFINNNNVFNSCIKMTGKALEQSGLKEKDYKLQSVKQTVTIDDDANYKVWVNKMRHVEMDSRQKPTPSLDSEQRER